MSDNVWQRDRIPAAANRYALGCWLPSRKIAAAAYVPGARERKPLRGGRPYFYVFNFSLAANQTFENRVSVPADFIGYALMVSSTVGNTQANPGARIQMLDAKRKKRFSIIGLNDAVFGGSAQNPFLLRKPYRFHAGGEILVRAQNLQSSANTVQVVLHGVQDL